MAQRSPPAQVQNSFKFGITFAVSMKVLIIEDNRELASNIYQFLIRESYICECCYTFKEAQEKLASYQYDSIILDIMLPDGNGLQLLDFIKSLKPFCRSARSH